MIKTEVFCVNMKVEGLAGTTFTRVTELVKGVMEDGLVKASEKFDLTDDPTSLDATCLEVLDVDTGVAITLDSNSELIEVCAKANNLLNGLSRQEVSSLARLYTAAYRIARLCKNGLVVPDKKSRKLLADFAEAVEYAFNRKLLG